MLFLLNILLLGLEKVGTGCSDHLAMIKTAETLDAFRHKLFNIVDLSNYLWVFQATDNVNDHTLQVIWVYEQFLRWNIVALPKKVDLFTDLASTAIIDPFKLAHG